MMKKNILLFVFFIIAGAAYGQPIYRGLLYGMSENEAKKEFKTNKDLYDEVDFSNGFVWRTYTQNFIYQNDSLMAVLMTPKGAALGLSHDGSTQFLEFSRAFFENKGYEVFFEPEYWQYPLNFHSKYGLLMSNADKTIMVQLYPLVFRYGNTTSFTSCLKIMNYKWFIREWEIDNKIQQQKSENSGF